MEMKEEMMARLEAMLEKNQEKKEARIDTNENLQVLRGTLVSLMDMHQARTEAIQEEITAKMDAHQERMGASVNVWRKETMACQEVTQACLENKERTSLEIKSLQRCIRRSLKKRPQ
jgi:hypothetical protein